MMGRGFAGSARRAFAPIAIACMLGGCALLPGSSNLVVTTAAGELRGAQVAGVHAYRGVPYAQAPIGELRWRAPRVPESWDGIRAATRYGPHCAQFDNPVLWFELDRSSEDCLTLNVWTPASDAAAELPVMVWIHGGGYVNGSGNIARLNSPAFAKRGVVLVTVNYRLSVFGFMTHPALAASNPDEPNGNYALQDLLAALRWIQANISEFGGNPDNVTIFGESAGAGLVNTLLVMPAAAGLFHKAISQSSSVGLSPEPYADRRAGFQPPSDKAGIAFARRAGIEDFRGDSPDVAAALRKLSTADILATLNERDRFTPIVDGKLLPDHVGTLLAAGQMHAVPYITGGVSWEASLGRDIGGPFAPENMARLVPDDVKASLYQGLSGPALDDAVFGDLVIYAASDYTAEHMAKEGVAVYRYFFSYLASARRATRPGPAHADDIAFVLGTLDAESDLTTISEADRAASELLQTYWVRFAATGDPNGPGLPEWPAVGNGLSPVLEIGEEIFVHEEFLRDRLDYHRERSEAMLARSRE